VRLRHGRAEREADDSEAEGGEAGVDDLSDRFCGGEWP
jgi:hypothetical protein